MKYFFVILLLMISISGKAQLIPEQNQYMFNGLLINPAYAGSRGIFTTSASYRSQWAGFEGAPVNQSFSAHAPLKKNDISLGLIIMNDVVPASVNTSISSDYAFRIRMGEGMFSFGLRAGINIASENTRGISIEDPADPAFVQKRFFLPIFGTGVYYFTPKFYAGLSIPTLLTAPENRSENSFGFEHHFLRYHYLVTAGYLLDYGEKLKIKPSFLISYQKALYYHYHLNTNFILFDDFFWIGVSYRSDRSFVSMIQFQVNPQLNIGYSFDHSFGELGRVNNGSHEIMLRYDFVYRIKAVDPKFF